MFVKILFLSFSKICFQGDSGGPLHLVTDGVFKQIGITSFGSSLGCEIGFHAGFTRTASFLEWIETNTGLAIDP